MRVDLLLLLCGECFFFFLRHHHLPCREETRAVAAAIHRNGKVEPKLPKLQIRTLVIGG